MPFVHRGSSHHPSQEQQKDKNSWKIRWRLIKRRTQVWASLVLCALIVAPLSCQYPFHFRFYPAHASVRIAKFVQHWKLSDAKTDITNWLSERAKSPNFAIDLPSNNPFRNRANSPNTPNSLPSPQNLSFNHQGAPLERPRSRNPFLDQTETEQPNLIDPISVPSSPRKAMPAPESPKKGQLYGNTAELFVGPSLEISLVDSCLIYLQRII